MLCCTSTTNYGKEIYISFFNKVVLWQATWTMWWSVGKFPPSSTSLPPDSKKGITVTLPKTSYGPWVDIWHFPKCIGSTNVDILWPHEFPCSTFTDLIFRDSYPSRTFKGTFLLEGSLLCRRTVLHTGMLHSIWAHDEKRPNHRTAVKYWILCDVVRETFQTLP